MPKGTKSAKLTVTFSMDIDSARAVHEALKLLTGTPANLHRVGPESGAAVLAAVSAARMTARVENPKELIFQLSLRQ